MVRPYPNENGDIQHSYRHYSPDYFKKLWEDADGHKEEARVRETLMHMEDGRFYSMLNEMHKMICALDPDERESFFDSNPRMKTWVNIFGMVEELKTFE